MTERCSFCLPTIESMDKRVAFESPKDRYETLCSMIEAYGELCGCGEDRLICIPLINLSAKFHEES